MISDPTPHGAPEDAYVWIWLPGETIPLVAGRIIRDGERYRFNYGRSYLARNNAVPIYDRELPLVAGTQTPDPPLSMAGCLRDGAPDAWGRRVIINRLTGLKGNTAHTVAFDELTFMLHSGSDRVGALDFQSASDRYTPRDSAAATLVDLQEAADRLQKGEPIPPTLDHALFHGTSIGGANPKALIDDGARKFIAKFSATSDSTSVVKAEFIAMRLGEAAGLRVAPVTLTLAAGRDVLLVERFDRARSEAGWTRHAMVSALTLFGLDEMQARYASYSDLAERIRHDFSDPHATLLELFSRMVLNVLVGNTDDHARNHAAFCGTRLLSLTPAYDICPQPRNGREANQAMLIHEDDRRARLATCLLSAPSFLLSRDAGHRIIGDLIDIVETNWLPLCDEARLSSTERAFLWKRQFLNAYAFEDWY